MTAFLERHRGMKIDLAITNEFVDLVATHVDIAIRFGELADSGLVAKRLGVSRRVLVAAPSYLKERGAPRSPRDLPAHDCVVFLGKTEGAEWRLENGRRRVRVRVGGRVSANNLELAHELAVRGRGVALLPEPHAVEGAPQAHSAGSSHAGRLPRSTPIQSSPGRRTPGVRLIRVKDRRRLP